MTAVEVVVVEASVRLPCQTLLLRQGAEHVVASLLRLKTLLKTFAAKAAGTGLTGLHVTVAAFWWVMGTPASVAHPSSRGIEYLALLHACLKSSHGAAGALSSPGLAGPLFGCVEVGVVVVVVAVVVARFCS